MVNFVENEVPVISAMYSLTTSSTGRDLSGKFGDSSSLDFEFRSGCVRRKRGKWCGIRE